MDTHIGHGWQSNRGGDSAIAHRILRLIFRQYPGNFTIRLWDGSKLRIGNMSPAFTLGLQQPWVLRDLVLFHDPVRLAEAYFNGALEVDGDFNAAMNLRYHLEHLQLSLQEKIWLVYRALTLGLENPIQASSSAKAATPLRQNNVESIAFHYDVSNEFYRLWLDERMLYSCAYFENAEQDLEQAQCNKLDHICHKLRLRPGESYLDIGCGWGALVCWAAKHYGVRAHGITLSQNQFQYACDEVKRQGLEGQVSIELRDYRDLPPVATYDKVSSIGMFEHVGLKNLPGYFAIVRQVLKPNGLFLNHGITSDEPDWRNGVSTRFINRYVFPDGELDTVSNIQQLMEEANFEIFDVEGLRPHYAMTLRHWVQRLEQKHEQVVALVGERTYRIWRLYMTACALQFEQGATGIYQILAVRRENGLPKLPLTRRDLYATT
jgi:cyclopropane-fatty-acyl-phospholipid synthase